MTLPAPESLPIEGAFAEDGTHWLAVRVFYEDTDFTGMVYHANYLKFCERGRSSFLRAAGIGHAELLEREDPSAFTVIRAEVDFKRAARVDDLLLVRTRYTGVTGVRIGFSQAVMRGEEVLAEAEITAVAIHMNGRARRPIPEVVQRLSGFVFSPDKSGE